MKYEEYLKLPGLRASEIKELWRSPAHYKEYHDNPPEQTAAMKFGEAVHAAIIEPQRFLQEYTAIDDAEIVAQIGGAKPRATTRYKEWRADFILDNLGKEILDLADFNKVVEIAQVAGKHPIVEALLNEPGQAEMVLQWKHHSTGTKMKARLDWVTDSGRIIDFKTTEDARENEFSRAMWKYAYHLQAAVYQEAVEEIIGQSFPFTFVVIEKTAPYGLMVYELDRFTLDFAMSEVDRLIRIYEKCAANDNWPAYSAEIRSIQLPAWTNVTEVA